MARIRTIKPEAFIHEGLYDAEHDTKLPLRWAFAGLWCHADRRGRFEWRPRRLQVGILPHDKCDFARVLDALTTRGFIRHYACQGVEYGWIESFQRHQVINNRESESELPPHPEDPDQSTTWTRDPRVDDACPTELQPCKAEGKGRERKGRSTRTRDLFGDDDDSTEAWLYRSWPVWFSEERHGAKIVMKKVKDKDTAKAIAETWTDRAYLEKLARAFLSSSSDRLKWCPERTLAQFASSAAGIDAWMRSA